MIAFARERRAPLLAAVAASSKKSLRQCGSDDDATNPWRNDAATTDCRWRQRWQGKEVEEGGGRRGKRGRRGRRDAGRRRGRMQREKMATRREEGRWGRSDYDLKIIQRHKTQTSMGGNALPSRCSLTLLLGAMGCPLTLRPPENDIFPEALRLSPHKNWALQDHPPLTAHCFDLHIKRQREILGVHRIPLYVTHKAEGP